MDDAIVAGGVCVCDAVCEPVVRAQKKTNGARACVGGTRDARRGVWDHETRVAMARGLGVRGDIYTRDMV